MFHTLTKLATRILHPILQLYLKALQIVVHVFRLIFGKNGHVSKRPKKIIKIQQEILLLAFQVHFAMYGPFFIMC